MDMKVCKICLKQTVSYFSLEETGTTQIFQSLVRIPKCHLPKLKAFLVCVKCLLHLKMVYKFQLQISKACGSLRDRRVKKTELVPENVIIIKDTLHKSESNLLATKQREKCRICGYVVREDLFSNHLRLHFNNNQQCNMCNELFPNVKILRQHLQSHEDKQRFECLNCGLSFQYPSIYDLHITKVCCLRTTPFTEKIIILQEEPINQKEKTPLKTYSKRSRLEHLTMEKQSNKDEKTEHQDLDQGIEKREETGDIDIFWDKEEPDMEIDMAIQDNANINIYGESIDLAPENNAELIAKNRAPEYQPKKYEETADINTCDKCEETFTNPLIYIEHIRDTMRCRKCADSIRACANDKHAQMHRNEKLMCHICGSQVKNLNLHVQIVHQQKKYNCKHCSKKFKLHRRFKVHMLREHGGKRTVVCETCGKAFFTIDNLFRHNQFKHLKLREHVCFHCKKAFSTRYAMRTHMRIHTNELPYRCDICAEGYAVKISLTNHMKIKHSIVDAITCHCKECGKGFATPVALYAHSRVHL